MLENANLTAFLQESMAKALETILPDFTPSELQAAAIERILKYKEELKGYGMYVRTAMELEFHMQNARGELVPGAIDIDSVSRYLREQEELPYVEKVDVEGEIGRGMRMPKLATQYEINLSDNASKRNNAKGLAPEKLAAVAHRIKTQSLSDMLLESTCLTPQGAEHPHPLIASFHPRPNADEPKGSFLHNTETSALHVNISLCDKHGRNLFAHSDKLLDHCVRSLLELQNDAALPLLPSEDSLKRIGANSSAPGGIGVKHGKFFAGSMHTSVTVRRYILDKDPYIPEAEATRIENRLPGGDADPFVAMAVTMAAMVDAVRKHVRKEVDGEKQKIHLKIDDITPGDYPKYDLPKKHSDYVTKFEKAAHMRELLGGRLYDAILAEYSSGKAVLTY